MIGAIKEACRESNSSVWIIGHVAKGAAQNDLKNQSSRGGGAIEADVQTAVTMGRDLSAGSNAPTILSIIKNRISTVFDELKFHGELKEEIVEDDFGELQTLRLLVGNLTKSSYSERMSQKEAKKSADKAQEAELKRNQLCSRIIAVISQSELILNRAALKSTVGGNNDARGEAINYLLREEYLIQRNLTPDEKERAVNPNGKEGLFLTRKKYGDFDI